MVGLVIVPTPNHKAAGSSYITNRLKSYQLRSLWMCFFVQTALLLSQIPRENVGEPIDAERLYDAVNVILSLQVI